MTEIPRLREIAENVEPFAPDIDIATAMIATVEPKTLDQAKAKAYREAGFGALIRPKITLEAEDAEAEFDKVLQEPSGEESRKEARERLERLLAQEVGASQIEHEERIDLSLAHAVDRKRRYLAKPMRWTAEATCAAVIGAMGAFVAPVAVAATTHPVHKNSSAEASKPVELNTAEKVGAGVFAAACLALGGFLGSMATNGTKLERAYAKRRAQRIFENSKY